MPPTDAGSGDFIEAVASSASSLYRLKSGLISICSNKLRIRSLNAAVLDFNIDLIYKWCQASFYKIM
jgi:hypothetical protein